MNDLEGRIERLEKQARADKAEKPWLIVGYDNTEEPSAAELEAAKAKYKEAHPDWEERDFNVIRINGRQDMSDLENRIKKLEQRSEGDKSRATIVYVYDGKLGAEEERAKEKAIAEYKSRHPGWELSSKDICIQVGNEHTKELLERIKAGERT